MHALPVARARSTPYPAEVSEPLSVRSATSADAPAIQAIYAPIVRDSAISFEEVPPDVDEIDRRMLTPPRLPWLVVTRGAMVVGYAYSSRHRVRAAYRWSVDCSIYLQAQERGRGTGRQLYRQLFAELRSLGYVSVFAGVALPNDASVGIHEAMGFEPMGTYRRVGYKHGSWHDVGWWRLELAEPADPPVDPRSWQP